MITSTAWAGKRYAVLGLARSGRATVEALLASGAQVVAWDEDETARNLLLPGTGRGTVSEADGEGGAATSVAPAEGPLHHPADGPPPRPGDNLVLADPLTIDLGGFAGVVVSPGVPINRHPIANAARAAGVPLIGDIELFAQARGALPPHKVVGITGTNGKSTTTALIHHILNTAGVPTTMGGNIGLPILRQEPLPKGGVYVLELSSFQIDVTFSLDCDVAVLLNITPDHLDRYDSFEAYAAAKQRLFEMQSSASIAVTPDDRLSIDDPFDVWGPFGDDGREPRDARQLGVQVDWPSLQGPHNAQNALAAITTLLALGIREDMVSQGLRTFQGLPHRMERIRERDGVGFVNDSKATNPDSAAPALAAYPRVRWIVGGRAKSADLDACAPHFAHVVAAYTIGEAGDAFADLLTRAGVATTRAGTLQKAVLLAARDAVAGDTVLLSPACASFDQFTDFEARGAAFRAAVEAL